MMQNVRSRQRRVRKRKQRGKKITEENSNIKVGKLNVDNAQDIAMEYNVMSIPTIVVFKNGTEYKRFIGVTSKSEILNALN